LEIFLHSNRLFFSLAPFESEFYDRHMPVRIFVQFYRCFRPRRLWNVCIFCYSIIIGTGV